MGTARHAPSLIAAIAAVLLACDDGPLPPELHAIEPDVVGTGGRTPAALHGSNLHPAVFVDLDDGARPPEVRRDWQVRIGPRSVPPADVSPRDPETLDVVIPAGVPPGVHDVLVISPTGIELTLPDALTVQPGG